jgi:uroporphyrinogen-III decarboxylase
MTENQWSQLVKIVNGDVVKPLPVGFIIDSPWLPGWAGISIMDYFSSEQLWLEANLKVVKRFPDVIFLPGFWSEYGMCTEPSAFGSKCVFHENELPFADKIVETQQQMTSLRKPDVKTDGLLPFTLRRLQNTRKTIEKEGHVIKFAVARGPLNIASFLMGTTEFMIALKESPQESHAMLNTITDFLCDWIKLQKETIPSIEGVFLLDDLAGFLGGDDFKEFAVPYLKRSFNEIDAKVRFFHNDAGGLVCAPYLADIGVNLFNFSFQHGMKEMLDKTGGKVCLLGNIPPRDVLAGGKPDDVRKGIKAMFEGVSDTRRIVASCGGGMSQNTPTENIETFIKAVREL